MTCGMTKDQLQASLLSIFNTNMAAASFIQFPVEIVAATKAQAAEAIKCLELYSDEQLEKMKVFLFCFLFSKISV